MGYGPWLVGKDLFLFMGFGLKKMRETWCFFMFFQDVDHLT